MGEKQTNRNISKLENLSDFNIKHPKRSIINGNHQKFRFFTSAECGDNLIIPYRRRDFFKVSLLLGDYIIHYMEESIQVSGYSLSIFSPHIPYTIETISEENNAGYFIFTEEFYNSNFMNKIATHPLFTNFSKPIFNLDEDEFLQASALFSHIETHCNSSYVHKNDLILNKINEVLHFSNQLQPSIHKSNKLNAGGRLYVIFNELLNRQFPMDDNFDGRLRKPSEFANSMHVHVNYLNRVLKNITGKSTQELINLRFLEEAIVLLKHSNMTIAEIAYSLGFKDVSHFNHFFKKSTDTIPSNYRN